MSHIHFVTGRTCVGKTSWMREMTDHAERARGPLGKPQMNVVTTSALARTVAGYDEMAVSANPAAPVISESAVRDGIKAHIEEMRRSKLPNLFVDSFPRSLGQVEWLRELAEMEKAQGNEVRVLYCWCRADVLAGRVEKRLASEPEKAKLTVARLAAEGNVFSLLLESLLASGLPIDLHDLTSTPQKTRAIDDEMDFGAIVDEHATFNDLVLRDLLGQNATGRLIAGGAEPFKPYGDNGTWSRRFLRALAEEVREAQAEIPDEWWTKDVVDPAKLREELIDAFHFLLSASFASGMDARAFVREYRRKLAINVGRQRSGAYKKHE